MSNCVRVSDTRGHLSVLLQRKRVNWVTWSFDGHYLISNYVIQLRLTVIRDGEAREKREGDRFARRRATLITRDRSFSLFSAMAELKSAKSQSVIAKAWRIFFAPAPASFSRVLEIISPYRGAHRLAITLEFVSARINARVSLLVPMYRVSSNRRND